MRLKKRQPAPSSSPPPAAANAETMARPPQKPSSERYIVRLSRRVQSLVRAIQDNDEARIEEAILRLSQTRRVFAPLAMAIGAFVLLFDGLRLLVSNWRLTLVQIVPAMWIWAAMYDLRAHILHGKGFHGLRGPILIPICLAIIAITIVSFFLNAVFAMAIAQSGRPEIRPAVAQARRHLTQILISGTVVGIMLAFASMFSTRLGRGWFTLSQGIVIGVMMVAYVALPARLIGVKPSQPPREKLTTALIGGLIGATVCTPPYLIGRLGILMLGSKVLFVPGLFVLSIGVTLQAGATGAVRAIKMSAKLRRPPHSHRQPSRIGPEPHENA